MSYFSSIGQGLTDLAKKGLARFDNITDPILRNTAETLDQAIENSSRIVDQLVPEESQIVQKELLQYYGSGLSQGEIKLLVNKFPELADNLEVLADKNLINTMLGRQGITKDQFSQILGNVTAENKESVIKLLKDKELSTEQLAKISHLITEESMPILQQLLKDKQIDVELLRLLTNGHLKIANVDVLRAMSQKGNVPHQDVLYIMDATTADNAEIALKMLQKADVNYTFDSILRKLQKPLNATEDRLKIYEAQKKFFSELLDNPEFKIPEDSLDYFRLSKVIASINPDNIDIAQKALLGGLKPHNLDEFLVDITADNKALASRIIDLVEGEIELPHMGALKPEHLEKYLDKVEKITNVEARKHYIQALDYLQDSNADEILKMVEASNPAEAKHASAVIEAICRGYKTADEIEPAITRIEKSGRQLDNVGLVNLAMLSRTLEGDKLEFFNQILKNQKIHDYDLESYLIAYSSKVQQAEDMLYSQVDSDASKYLQEVRDILESLTKNEALSQRDVLDIFRSVNVDNIGVLKSYATTPNIKNIDPSAIKSNADAQDIEAILATDIPRHYQRELLPVIKSTEEGGVKRLEFAQNLVQRGILSSKIADIIRSLDEESIKYIDEIITRSDLDDKTISYLIDEINKGKGEIVKELLQNPKIKKEYLKEMVGYDELIMPVYKVNPEQIITAFEHKMPIVYYDIFNGDKLISDMVGEKRYAQMLKGIAETKAKYGIEPKKTLSLQMDANAHSNDLFIILKDDHVTYKFNKKSGKLVSVQTQETTINVRTNTRTSDYVAAECKLQIGDEQLPDVPYLIETVHKGKKGTLKTIYAESAIKGQYDIIHAKPDGTRVKVGRAQFTPNGAQHVSRTLTSANGHKTSLSYRKDAAGNVYFHSVIRNKSGEVISDVTRKRTVISDNHFITSCNDQAFDIVFTNDRVVVTKLDSMGKKTKETVEFAIKDIPIDTADKIVSDIKDFEEDEICKVAGVFRQYGIEPKTIDRRCVPMLKELPGDEWFAMDKSAEFIMPQGIDDYNAFYAGNSIFMGKEHMKNLGVYCHELGHAKFHTLNLANDPELLKIYNAEKQVYTSTFPESRISSIDYFLEDNHREMRGLNEACAETNLVSDTIQSWDQIQDRTIFYEQFFPETIAYIRKRYAEMV